MNIIKSIKKLFENNLAITISKSLKFYDKTIEIKVPIEYCHDFFTKVTCAKKIVLDNTDNLLSEIPPPPNRNAILLNGNLNHDTDIQALLDHIYKCSSRYSRVFAIIYNPYFSAILRLITRIFPFIQKKSRTFITKSDLQSLSSLCNFEILEQRPTSIFPFHLFGIGNIIDSILTNIPIIKELSLMYLVVLRPILKQQETYSISIIIPAKDEEDNIKKIMSEIPNLPCKTELIFVEGHSADNTWDEILKIKQDYSSQNVIIKTLQQKGKGKSDAVSLGISHATCDLLTILDSDLTTPPETLLHFYTAFCTGKADFINGNRLLYPQEKGAMQYLNLFGNIFFAKILSFTLKTKISDSLCGTKLFTRYDYEKFCKWKIDFQSKDPFGDFDLLFPAAILKLGIINLPIRYKSRTYGTTKISRFKDGWELFKMAMKEILRLT